MTLFCGTLLFIPNWLMCETTKCPARSLHTACHTTASDRVWSPTKGKGFVKSKFKASWAHAVSPLPSSYSLIQICLKAQANVRLVTTNYELNSSSHYLSGESVAQPNHPKDKKIKYHGETVREHHFMHLHKVLHSIRKISRTSLVWLSDVMKCLPISLNCICRNIPICDTIIL